MSTRVPRNRREIDRDQKLEEILAAAEALLLQGGYEALTPAAIARRLGLARAAIYWYFPTRDDLFVAAVGRIFAPALANPPDTTDYARRIQWAVETLAELRPINLALHDRARHSDAAADLEAAIKTQLCERLREVLRDHIDPARIDQVADTVVVFIEGLLAHDMSAKDRQNRLQFLLNTLIQ